MLSILATPGPSSACLVVAKSVRQHMIVKGGKLKKSESPLICVVIAEGSTSALPVSTRILVHLYNCSVLGQQECPSSVSDQWHSVAGHRILLFRCHHSLTLGLCYCDVERDCPQADGDEPAGDWATSHDSVHVVFVNKKSNATLYRTISLISHPSKVMLKIISRGLKPQAEKIIAEEQAGFRAGRSTTEQIFNLRILCEK